MAGSHHRSLRPGHHATTAIIKLVVLAAFLLPAAGDLAGWPPFAVGLSGVAVGVSALVWAGLARIGAWHRTETRRHASGR